MHTLTIRVPDQMLLRLDDHLDRNDGQSRTAIILDALDNYLPKANVASATLDTSTPRTLGRQIAEILGTLVSGQKNLLRLRDGRMATVRVSRAPSKKFGVYDHIRDQTDVIFCAQFDKDTKLEEIWSVPVEAWIENASGNAKNQNRTYPLTAMTLKNVRDVGMPVDLHQ